MPNRQRGMQSANSLGQRMQATTRLRVFQDWWSFPWQMIGESRNFKLNEIVAFRSAKVCQTLLSWSERRQKRKRVVVHHAESPEGHAECE